MMDVSLITAPIVTEFTAPGEVNSESVRRSACEPQLGILSLAAVLEKHGHRPRIVDLNHAYLKYVSSGTNSAKEFVDVAARFIVDSPCQVYGFGSICSSYPLTIRIAEAVKALSKDSVILLGGPQASVVDLKTLSAFPFIDLVLRGEAEQSFPILLDELARSHRLDRVPGLTLHGAIGPQRNCNAPIIEDLDSLPSPAYHLTGALLGAKKAALELGRGCPFACTFCSTNDFFRRNFRLRSPERVLADMRAISAQYSIGYFDLVHDMFTVDRRRVVAFCQAMIRSGEKFAWSCSARTDCVDPELLELMAVGGCVGIFLGIESGSPRIQKLIDKHLDPRQAENVIDIAEQLGIHTTVALITGFPEERWDDVRQTMEMFMYSTRHVKSNPQLGILAPLADTPVHTAHKDELTLDELCSDVSQQSTKRNDADLHLIKAHPEIFPNFYLIPTPFLDRDCLLELREFALISVECLRWLFSALHQESTHIIDFFMEWRIYRLEARRSLRGFDLRQYYRQEFRDEFLEFVRTHPIGKSPSVAALLDYENRVSKAFFDCTDCAITGTSVPLEDCLLLDDTVAPSPNVKLIELPFNIQQLVDALKVGAVPSVQRGPHFYISREETPGVIRLHRVSDWIACLLRSCKESRPVWDVLGRLATEISEIDEDLRPYAFVKLLKAAQADGAIGIFRSHTQPSDHQGSAVVQ